MQDPIYAKTPFGQQAVNDRSCCPDLTPRLRALLLQVDGQKTASTLLEVASKMGAAADAAHTLFVLGLIQVREAEIQMEEKAEAPVATPQDAQLQQAARAVRNAASEYLGMKALLFNRRVDKAGSLAELKTLLAELHQGIHASKGAVRADMVLKKIITLMK